MNAEQIVATDNGLAAVVANDPKKFVQPKHRDMDIWSEPGAKAFRDWLMNAPEDVDLITTLPVATVHVSLSMNDWARAMALAKQRGENLDVLFSDLVSDQLDEICDGWTP